MSIDTIPSRSPKPLAPERLRGVLLPVLLQVGLLAALTGGAVWVILRILFRTTSGTQETHFVLRRLTEPLSLGLLDQLGLAALALLLVGGAIASLVYSVYLLGKTPGKGRAGRLIRSLLLAVGCFGYLGCVVSFCLFGMVWKNETASYLWVRWVLMIACFVLGAGVAISGTYLLYLLIRSAVKGRLVGRPGRTAILYFGWLANFLFLGALLLVTRSGGKELGSGALWLLILVPASVSVLVFVVWMYGRDSLTVGGPWATFLGTLRYAAYALLALVFLLPAWQTWETTESHSKVLLVLDVSGSTAVKDDLPTETLPVEKLLSRQDKVIRFLTDNQVGFLRRLQDRNPVTVYRFGSLLDEEFKTFEGDGQWSADQWNTWLKPDPRREIPNDLGEEERAKARKKMELEALLVNGTNVGEALLGVLNREKNNMLQGIVIISDGRSTQYSAQTFADLQARATQSKVPIFTVGVGTHRQPVNLRITELMVPDQARPDDKFPIRVEVDGEGLPDKEVEVALDIFKPKTDPKKDKPAHTLKALAKFSKDGTPPHAQVEFPIEAAQLPAELRKADAPGKPELDEGEWRFVARVARDRGESFLGKEHVSDPATVNVVKRPLRVLLFASGPTRDFQFARTLFVRESDRRRAELSICLQLVRPGVVQDVPGERLLAHFPSVLKSPGEKVEDRYDNLAEYDLIIAFDPDWTQLLAEHIAQLERWVEAGGGLIVVGGPIHTFQLTRTVNLDRFKRLKTILDLYPVLLDDSRLQGLGPERPTAEPWRLNFPGATSEMEFLKLDEDKSEALAGWEEFFTGKAKGEGGKDVVLRRGFYDYYPVKDKKPSATVVATFPDPHARLSDGREQPYLVVAPYKRGKVVWLGSGEVWRLRQYREAYHERFWTKLARYAASGALSAQKNPSNIFMGREFTANNFARLEAQLLGGDIRAIPRTERPRVKIKPPPGVTLPELTPPGASGPEVELLPKPSRPDDWNGWFSGRFLVTAPGNYELQLTIPGTSDVLTRKFGVKEANPELDNTRPDFLQLRQIASDAAEVLARVKAEADRNRVKQELERTNRSVALESPGDDKDRLRLYFDLKAAETIPDCMKTDSKSQKTPGRVDDWWDAGYTFDGDPKDKLSYALIIVISLLSMEWLTRKLLKLA